jgi:DNA replication protein DnaC
MTAFCADCDQTGFRFDAASNTAFPCACRESVLRQRRARKMMRALPARYASVALEREPLCSLDEPVRQRIGAYVREMDARLEGGRGLWLGGERGTGKTSAAALLVKEASARGYAAGFHPLAELLVSLRGAYDGAAPGDVGSFAPEHEEQLIDRLCDLDLLVMDDVGAVRATPWVLQQLYVIVNRRYNDQRATVITTHLEREQLAAVLGWGIVSRLVEMTGRPVLFGGVDRRLEGEAA